MVSDFFNPGVWLIITKPPGNSARQTGRFHPAPVGEPAVAGMRNVC